MTRTTAHALAAGFAGALISTAGMAGMAADADRFAGGRGPDLLTAGLALSGTAGLALALADRRRP